MPPAERLRQILPIAAAVYLAASVAQIQTNGPGHTAPRVPTVEAVVSGLEWHMLEMAKNEQAGMSLGFPGN